VINLAPEAAPVLDLEHKTSPAGTAQTLAIEPEGRVTAIVSVTGVRDEVDDVMEPGCYSESLTRRRPKVIRNHDWNQQVGRVVSSEEWLPGDPRLPKETKDGRPWPAGAGALVAEMQYNLATKRGREAFEDIKFYAESGEAEFSIGYKVPTGASRRSASGARHVKRADLWEYSDVLFGAAPLTMALSLKDAHPGETSDDPPAVGETTTQTEPESAPENQLSAEPIPTEPDQPPAESPEPVPDDEPDAPDQPTAPDPSTEPGQPIEPEPVEPEPVEPAQPAPELAKPVEEPTTSPAESEPVQVEPAAAEPPMTDEQIADMHASAFAEIDWGQIAAAAQETAAALRAQCDAMTTPAEPAEDEPAEPEPKTAELSSAQIAEGLALLADVDLSIKRNFSAAERTAAAKKGAAMKDGSYPILSAGDLRNAIQALGRAKNREAVKAHIIKRAKALKLTWLLPADWPGSTRKESKDAVAEFAEANAERLAELEVKAEGGADRNRGNAERLRRWYVHGEGAAKIRWGQKGDFMRCVRIAGKHMRPDQAKGFCNLRHKDALGYYPATHAAREAAGRKSAEVAAGMPRAVSDDGKLTLWTPGAEVGPLAAYLPAETKGKLAKTSTGTLEARREAVRQAVFDELIGAPDRDGNRTWNQVSLLGTWDDRVVARREAWGPDGHTEAEAFDIGYGFDQVGRVVLGTPRPIDLEAEPAPGFEDTVHGVLQDATSGIKVLLEAAGRTAHGLEVKEGRVLSRVNLKRLQAAVTSLLAVLAAAGVEVVKPTEKEVEEERRRDYPAGEPLTTPDTTSDGAREAAYGRKSGESVISAEELARGLALLVP
jgi:hypothetical protein